MLSNFFMNSPEVALMLSDLETLLNKLLEYIISNAQLNIVVAFHKVYKISFHSKNIKVSILNHSIKCKNVTIVFKCSVQPTVIREHELECSFQIVN